jgi:hypothetical protein
VFLAKVGPGVSRSASAWTHTTLVGTSKTSFVSSYQLGTASFASMGTSAPPHLQSACSRRTRQATTSVLARNTLSSIHSAKQVEFIANDAPVVPDYVTTTTSRADGALRVSVVTRAPCPDAAPRLTLSQANLQRTDGGVVTIEFDVIDAVVRVVAAESVRNSNPHRGAWESGTGGSHDAH